MWPFCQKAEAWEASVAIAKADRDLIYANFYFRRGVWVGWKYKDDFL